MQRLLMVLALATVLGAGVASAGPTATPAVAAQPTYTCTRPGGGSIPNVAPRDVHRFRKDGYTCTRDP